MDEIKTNRTVAEAFSEFQEILGGFVMPKTGWVGVVPYDWWKEIVMEEIKRLCKEVAHPEWYYDRASEYNRVMAELRDALSTYLEQENLFDEVKE